MSTMTRGMVLTGMEPLLPLSAWVIFERPVDYPEHFVVRRMTFGGGYPRFDQIGVIVGSLADARAQVPLGLVCVPRAQGDEGQIVETWI